MHRNLRRRIFIIQATDELEADNEKLDKRALKPRAELVPAGSHRLRQHDAGRVDRLKDVPAVDPSRDLLDEDGGQPLGPQLLVDAEEVDLDQVLDLLVDSDGGRNGADEANQLVAFGRPDAAVPLAKPPYG